MVKGDERDGIVNLWGSFVGSADMYMRDGLHLGGKGQRCLLMNYHQQSTVGSITIFLVASIV